MNLCMLMIVNLGMASADDVCTAVKSNLPDSCACVAAGRLGGKVTCTESIDLGVPKGKFEATFALDLKACGSPASIELTATFPEVDPMTEKFEASVDPGSITIPVGAAISIPGIDVLVGYDLKESEGKRKSTHFCSWNVVAHILTLASFVFLAFHLSRYNRPTLSDTLLNPRSLAFSTLQTLPTPNRR